MWLEMTMPTNSRPMSWWYMCSGVITITEVIIICPVITATIPKRVIGWFHATRRHSAIDTLRRGVPVSCRGRCGFFMLSVISVASTKDATENR
ncbi:Uncharacterised protein [Mycobacteroides abscessus subsp. abscessus]|nr:Uncharacterised protein [Mycobacteroides abscessus subsp. abscessus]